MNGRAGTTALWSVCFTAALGLHGAGAYALLAHWTEASDRVASAPLVMLELAPAPVAPVVTPNGMPPGPQQAEAQADDPVTPVEIAELQPAQQAELPLTPPPKPIEKPKDKKPKQKHATLASAPSVADNRAERAAALAPGAGARDSNALPNWKSQLVARLERYKRYPPDAQSRGEQGVAQLAFSVDRSGGVHHARIAQSSGSSALDRETLLLLERAQPLPPPPADISGAQIAIVVPIRYNFH